MVEPIHIPEIGVASATLSAWFVHAGESVHRGARVAEMLLEGATMDILAPTSGWLTQRLVAVDARIIPGQVIGYLEPTSRDRA